MKIDTLIQKISNDLDIELKITNSIIPYVSAWEYMSNVVVFNENSSCRQRDWLQIFLHELIHWTDLKFKRINEKDYNLRDIEYETEELTADIGSLLLLDYLNLKQTFIVKKWEKANHKKAEKQAIIAANFIIQKLKKVA